MEEADEDEDEQISVGDVPFIAEKDFLLKYGRTYLLAADENQQIVLTSATSSTSDETTPSGGTHISC
ncbi:MAG: hypothetical protein AUJ49_08910 [Desulfovibrionaceae bacterium CG1_02_65_16]|nr:MAG: hypothetical protein AUJ49_08910 [Desulfovibrionaceae bacterium CG1_02_65_16]